MWGRVEGMLTQRELSVLLLDVFWFGGFVYVKNLVRAEDNLALCM